MTKDVAKNVAKCFAKTRTAKATGTARATAHIGVDTRMAILVIGCTFVGVRQHLVGLFDLFELRLRFLGFVALVAVGVVLHREFAIGLFDFVLARAFGKTENFIKIAFGHGVGSAVCVGLDQDFAACSPFQAKRGEVSSESGKGFSLF